MDYLANHHITISDAGVERTDVGDIYFSREDAVAESEYVFIHANDLPARFTTLKPTDRFTIAETGFGTGLNFFLAAQHFLKHAHAANTHLHFISFEKFPLAPDMLRRIHAQWPEHAALRETLLAQYPLPVHGQHRLALHPRITLSLILGDVNEQLPQHDFIADAWFLDGFAPAKNPDMWDAALMSDIAKHSTKNTSFATFTAAGHVKRGLADAGFNVRKMQGYGHKRDMLCGEFFSPAPMIATRDIPTPLETTPDTVTIIGAGIAGASIAYALALRGIKVRLYEKHGAPAMGASGNPMAVLFPQISRGWNTSSHFTMLAYAYMQRQIPSWRASGLAIETQKIGMLQMPRDAKDEEKLRNTAALLSLSPHIAHWCERAEASGHAGMPLSAGGLWFPDGAALSLGSLCAAWLNHPLITVHYNTPVHNIEPSHHGWKLYNAQQAVIDDAPILIVANGGDALQYAPLAHLPIRTNRGQLSYLPQSALIQKPQSIICQRGYIVPHPEGGHMLGASYDKIEKSDTLRAQDHAENIAHMSAMFEGNMLSNAVTADISDTCGGRASLRTVSRDRAPLLGKAYDANGAPLNGLYVSLAHGSRGALTAPLGAEHIADQITHMPSALPHAIQAMLCPSRFAPAHTRTIASTSRHNSYPAQNEKTDIA